MERANQPRERESAIAMSLLAVTIYVFNAPLQDTQTEAAGAGIHLALWVTTKRLTSRGCGQARMRFHVNASSCGQFAWFLLYQGKKSKWSFNPSFKRSLARIRRAMRVVGNMTAIEFSLVSMAWWRWCYAHPPKLPTSTQSRACLGTGCFPNCLAEFMTLFWWFETIGYCSKHDTTAQ